MGDKHVSRNAFRVISWNVNGIRTFENLKQQLDSLEADVVCLQETKVTRDMIDEPTAIVEGYNSYFSFSKTRSGYSGVATYCRERATPQSAEEGLSGSFVTQQTGDLIGCYDNIEDEFTPQELKRLDAEGRAIITKHKLQKSDGSEVFLAIINVYCPRADPERPDRLEFKLRFYRLLELRARAIRLQGSHVVIVGDVNTSHRTIDRCENVPRDEFEGNPGRQWLNTFIAENTVPSTIDDELDFKMVDSFRKFHPNKKEAYTCWNTLLNARATNFGSRIDYIFVDRHLISDMVDSSVLSDIEGSDHCPVAGSFNLTPIKAIKCPSQCIKFFPEFAGMQQKLSSFFSKKVNGCGSVADEPVLVKRTATEPFLRNNVIKKRKISGNASQQQISNFFTKPMKSDSDMSSSQESSSSNSDLSQPNVDCESEEAIKEVVSKIDKNNVSVSAWRCVFKGPRPPPLCKGHKEPCVERVVKKKGPNFNKKFYACARGIGSKNDPRARCDHFEWAQKI